MSATEMIEKLLAYYDFAQVPKSEGDTIDGMRADARNALRMALAALGNKEHGEACGYCKQFKAVARRAKLLGEWVPAERLGKSLLRLELLFAKWDGRTHISTMENE